MVHNLIPSIKIIFLTLIFVLLFCFLECDIMIMFCCFQKIFFFLQFILHNQSPSNNISHNKNTKIFNNNKQPKPKKSNTYIKTLIHK